MKDYSYLHDIDKKISDLAKAIDFYNYLTPVNQKDEMRKFFSEFSKGIEYNPLFEYRRYPLCEEKKTLETISAALDPSDDMDNLFLRKINFMKGQIDLLNSPDEEFTERSKELYGEPSGSGIILAEDIVRKKEKEEVFSEETVTPREMADILKKTLEEKNIDWEVIFNDRIVPKISISGMNKRVYINPDIMYTPQEAQRLKVHEIEVHVYRGANGDRQPFSIFREGLAGYDTAEEGIAVVAEEISGCLDIDTRQIKLYAGRYLSVSGALERSFYETYLGLLDFFPEDIAYRLVERSKRGMIDTSKKGAFTKELAYISGYSKVKEYMASGKNMEALYAGKVGFNDVDIVGRLLNKGMLKHPEYLPEFIENEKNS